jgi:Ca2+-binding RTX toxin-like protein
VTNPRAVLPVREYDLDEGDFEVTEQNDGGQGNFATNNSHDMVVKEINGRQTMLMSYWDSGYVTLNADDPANLRYLGDTDFDETDPFTGFRPPEGNGHQAEFSHDNRYILAADEDFDTFRLRARITSGPNSGFEFQQAGGADQGRQLAAGDQIDGDTRFVGQACTAAPPAPATAGVTIAVAERGTCSFEEKATNVDAAGYDTLLIFNNATGATAQCDGLIGMTLGAYRGDLLALFVARSVGMRIIDAYDPATYRCTPGDATSTPAPAAPREGSPLSIGVDFDGWGYAHLYRNGEGKMSKAGDYAIQEGVDERWASRFGDLSIHEWATDPATNLAYSSYYSGGFRVVQYADSGITETGRFIDQRPDGKGNDFWGVEQFTAANGERLIALSDRDYGLYIVRYTGPGAVGPTPPPPPGPKAGRCTNLLAVTAGQALAGSEFGEQITGTEGADTVNAGGGDDCVDGLGGNDNLRGGPGVDAIDGQRGNDRIRGDRGRGNLRGGTGNDRINGYRSRDVLFGNTGRDRLHGGRERDQLVGGAGRDRLTGGRGKDVIEGGTGNDRIYAKDGAVDRIDCGFGKDTVVSRDRKDKLTSCEKKAKLKKRKK